MTIEQAAVTTIGTPKRPRGKLAKILPKAVAIPTHQDPREELRLLVQQHRYLTDTAKMAKQRTGDRKIRATGEVLRNPLPEDDKAAIDAFAATVKRSAKRLESKMTKELRRIPIYTEFLSKVFGCGPVTAAHIVASVDIHRAIKPSSLRCFFGMAPTETGRLERPGSRKDGGKALPIRYNKTLRTVMFNMFASMAKQAGSDEKPQNRKTNKYLKAWGDYIRGMMQSRRVVDGHIEVAGKSVSAKGWVRATGWHRAASVFLDDLYRVWRAIEGLPVWGSYYEYKILYGHKGGMAQLAPEILTVEEALKRVGSLDTVACNYVEVPKFAAGDDEGDDDEMAEAAE